MVFGVGELLEWITRWITLKPGDRVEVEIAGIGALANTVGRRS